MIMPVMESKMLAAYACGHETGEIFRCLQPGRVYCARRWWRRLAFYGPGLWHERVLQVGGRCCDGAQDVRQDARACSAAGFFPRHGELCLFDYGERRGWK